MHRFCFNPSAGRIFSQKASLLVLLCYSLCSLLKSDETQSSQTHLNIPYSDFVTARSIALDIRRRFPPDQFYYVGSGRSPTIIVALLQAMAPDTVANIPFSSGSAILQIFQENSTNEFNIFRQRLFDHYQQFRLNPHVVRGRRVLLIDGARTGTSLLAALQTYRSFMQTLPENERLQIEALALTDIAPSLAGILPLVDFEREGISVLRNNRYSDFIDLLMTLELYHDYAEYPGMFDIFRPIRLPRGSRYDRLVASLHTMLGTDNRQDALTDHRSNTCEELVRMLVPR